MSTALATQTYSYPLISFIHAGNWGSFVDIFEPGDAEQWVTTGKNYGKHAYALRVKGHSMEPKYPQGCVVVVDPRGKAQAGDTVIARIDAENEATMKVYKKDALGNRFLKPINPAFPTIDMQKIDVVFCGVVREIAEHS
ncbi:LexA family protein [Magnetococcus sp. PR-3]|uniref:LexA family protein n=1 Tax=Magnetococcus sp. PR-3 TaxID=3120355 RepID=UPI002FCDF2AE